MAACGFPWCVACPHPGSDCPGCPTLLAGRHPFQYRIRHMVPRYSRPDMVAIWEPESKFRIWFEIEAHATDALAELGVVPKEAAAAIWEKGAFEVERIDAIEAEVKHDVIAFLTKDRKSTRLNSSH